MHTPLLVCRDISKRFGSIRALGQVSFSVPQGSFTCILGPSGCGKSTLLRVIMGLEAPDSGSIVLAGEDITNWPAARRGFGIVFQSYALFPNLTAAENVAYGLRGMRRAEKRQKAQAMLELVRLADVAERYPSELSGGQQQRVALARALAIEPRLLLLDEPLSALDAKVRMELRSELRLLQRRLGITTIMVTHDQEEALSLADDVVIMRDGNIMQIASPLDVYRCPRSAFVADFIGAMNFLPGWFVDDGWAYCGNQTLRVTSAANLHLREAIIGIRPEDVEIAAENETSNRLPARILRLEFRGPFYLAHLAIELRRGEESDKITLTAQFPAAHVERLRLQEGDALRIRLPCDRLHVYTDNGAGQGREQTCQAAALPAPPLPLAAAQA